MSISEVFNIENLLDYFVENGLSEEEANHLLHIRQPRLQNKTVMQLIQNKDWVAVRWFAQEYMLGL